MTKKTIFQVAGYFEQKLQKRATSNYPEPESVFPIIEKTVNSLKANPLLKGVIGVAKPVDVQNNAFESITKIYLQLIVESAHYNRLMAEPDHSELTNLVSQYVTSALKNAFSLFEFKVKVGVVPT